MRWKKIITWTLTALVLATLAYVVFVAASIWQYGDIDETRQADAAIVLGAAIWDDQPSPVFKERINHAIWLYDNGYVDKIIFTGGVAEGAQYSEASVARDHAVRQGVPAADILIEESSTITQENIYHAVQVAAKHNIEIALIVSDPLHMKRSMLIADDAGLSVYSSPTRTTAYQSLRTQLPFLAREVFFYIGHQIFG